MGQEGEFAAAQSDRIQTMYMLPRHGFHHFYKFLPRLQYNLPLRVERGKRFLSQFPPQKALASFFLAFFIVRTCYRIWSPLHFYESNTANGLSGRQKRMEMADECLGEILIDPDPEKVKLHSDGLPAKRSLVLASPTRMKMADEWATPPPN